MSLRLPPLSALRLFEAAGRLGSCKSAAAELNITASAVSHGIASLESALGVRLFARDPGRLTLTAEGVDYLAFVSEALALISAGTERLPGHHARRSIAVSCAPTIASRWLIPRLHMFAERWPIVDVRVDTSRRQVGFPNDGFDFAVRMSRTSVASPAWTRLFGETLTPVCSPAYREKLLNSDNGQFDLARASLIHVTPASEDWHAWAEGTGTRCVDIDRGLRFDTIQLAWEAAATGLGVAIGRKPLVDADLTKGVLVEAGLPALAADTSYWFVSSGRIDHRPELLWFQRWLLQEGAALQASLDARRRGSMVIGR